MDTVLMVLECSILIIVVLLTLVFLLSKSFFLSPYRIGWAMMFANILYETLFKKFGWRRWSLDAIALPLLTALWCALVSPCSGAGAGILMAVAWGGALRIDQRWRNGEMARQDRRYAGRVPLPLPRLVVTIRGPVLSRGRILELGDWPLGWQDSFEIVILNPSNIVPQLPIEIKVKSASPAVKVANFDASNLNCPAPGQYRTVHFTLRAAVASTMATEVTVHISHGDLVIIRKLRIRSIVSVDSLCVETAEIRRWKGGANAGFAWRGDQDLYDPATFQSAKGLRYALGLSMQFRLPSTLFLSSALSLDKENHKAFCEHFGWDRRSEEIPDFIRFLREEVTIENELEFPMNPDRQFAMELGNHMYVHLGTHTGAAEGNGWKTHAWIGDGRYPWQKEGHADSFTEQRDNAIKNNEVIFETLGVKATSWGVPGRTYDSQTARAVEAAGIEIGTDTNASAFTNVFRLVPPHHPDGCKRLVEITKKYPGDPDDAWKIAMLKYWSQAARRKGGVFLFMAHHHMLLYQGSGCSNMIKELFYHVLGDCHGDFYVATVTSLGKYWQSVLSPKTKSIIVNISKEDIIVENKGDENLEGLPLEIGLKGGGKFMKLVAVGAGESVKVSLVVKIEE